MSVTISTNGFCGNVRIVSSEIEQLKTNEFHRRRKLRLLQVREQSKDIAKKIRERAQRENILQTNSVDRLRNQAFAQKQGQFIEHLETLRKEGLQAVGDGHRKAQEAILKGNHQEKGTDPSKLRGNIAAALLQKASLEKLNKKKQLLERKVLARLQANERNKKKIALTKLGSQDDKGFDQQRANTSRCSTEKLKGSGLPSQTEEVIKNTPEAKTPSEATNKRNMETQWELPNTAIEIPTRDLNKDTDSTDLKKTGPIQKPKDLFALSDDMPNCLRGNVQVKSAEKPVIQSQLNVISDYLQNRSTRFNINQNFKKTNSLDLEGIKETIAKSKQSSHLIGQDVNEACHVLDGEVMPIATWRQASPSKPKSASKSIKTSIDSSVSKKDTVIQYNHNSRAVKGLPIESDDLVTKEKPSEVDAYSLAIRESEEQMNLPKKKTPQVARRGRVAMMKEKVTKEYEETINFLNKITKEQPEKPIRSAFMSDDRLEEQALRRQRNMQEDFQKAQRENFKEQAKRECKSKCTRHNKILRDHTKLVESQVIPNQKVITIKTADVTSESEDIEPAIADSVEKANCLLRLSKHISDKDKILDLEGLKRGKEALHNVKKRSEKDNKDTNKPKCDRARGDGVFQTDSVDAVPCRDTTSNKIPHRDPSSSSRNTAPYRSPQQNKNIDAFIDEILNVDAINYRSPHTYPEYQWTDNTGSKCRNPSNSKTPPTKERSENQYDDEHNDNVNKNITRSTEPKGHKPNLDKIIDSTDDKHHGLSSNTDGSQSTSNNSDIHGVSDGKNLIIYKVINAHRSKESINVAKSLTNVDKELRKLLADTDERLVSNMKPNTGKRMPLEQKNEDLKPVSDQPKMIHDSEVLKDGSDKENCINNKSLTHQTDTTWKESKKTLQWESLPDANKPQKENDKEDTNIKEFVKESIASSYSSFKTSKTSPKSMPSIPTDTEKVILGAAGLLDNNVYEVVIQLKRKDEVNKNEQNPKDQFVVADKEKKVKEAGVNTLLNNDASVKLRQNETEDRYSAPQNDHFRRDTLVSSSETTSQEQPDILNKNKTLTKSNVLKWKDQDEFLLKALYDMPTIKTVPMSSSASTAYTSPPEIILPKYLNFETLSGHPVSRKISFTNEIPPINNENVAKKIKKKCRKNKSHKIRTETKENEQSSKEKNESILLNIIKQLIEELAKKSDKGESKEFKRNRANISLRLQNYINQLLLVDKDEMKRIEQAHLQYSSVTTPASSIINESSNQESSNKQGNKELLETLKNQKLKEINDLITASEALIKNKSLFKNSCSRKTIPVYRTKVKPINIARMSYKLHNNSSFSDKGHKTHCCFANYNEIKSDITKPVTAPYKTIPSLKTSSGFVKPIKAAAPIHIPKPTRQPMSHRSRCLIRNTKQKTPKVHSVPSLEKHHTKAERTKPTLKSNFEDQTLEPYDKFSHRKVPEIEQVSNTYVAHFPQRHTSTQQCERLFHVIRDECLKKSKETFTENKHVSRPVSTQTHRDNVISDPLKRAEEKLHQIQKIAATTEKCSKRLSNLAKALDIVRRNKNDVHCITSSSENSEGGIEKKTPKSKRTSNSKNVVSDVPKVNKDVTEDFTPILGDIPKPLSHNNDQENIVEIGSSRKTLEKNSIIKPSMRPPTALSRIVLNNVAETQTPHELSTVVEMDTPVSAKKRSNLSDSKNVDNTQKTFQNNVIPKSVSARKLNLDVSKPSSPQLLKEVVKNLNSSPGVVNYSQKEKELLRTLQKSLTKDSNGKLKMMDMDKFNEIMLKPFLTLDEFAKKFDISKIEELSNLDEPSKLRQHQQMETGANDDLSPDLTDTSLPDIVTELLKRNLITEPFKFDSISNDPSSDSTLSILVTSKSKKTKNNTFETSDTFNISYADLQTAFEKFGIHWASSTLKKGKETRAYSSSTSTSHTSMPKEKYTRKPNKSNRKSELSRADASVLVNQSFGKKSIDQQTSGIKRSPVKDFLINELADKISFVAKNQNEDTEHDEFMSFYSTKPDLETNNFERTHLNPKPAEDIVSSKSKQRTSTPEQLFKSKIYDSSSSVSRGLFGNVDELSSVKGNSRSNDSTSEKDDLVLPNCSLRTKKQLSSELSSSDI